jgi:Protein of unknown function (DUF3501)
MTDASRRLTLDDIEDLRAYERGRLSYREQIIALKRRRRVALGPIVTLVFENRDTMRFQVQEMARAEHMLSDDQIQGELDTYNALIPGPGELSATMFIELTGEEALRDWLPKLVGVERAVELRLADGDVVRCVPEAAHEEALTREHVTASVHYIAFHLAPRQVEAFASGPVVLAVVHRAYSHETELSDEVRTELLLDLR